MNSVLKSMREVHEASAYLSLRGVPFHQDYKKNWDAAEALKLAENEYHGKFDAVFLDAGGEKYSNFAPALRELGYRRLAVANIAFTETKTVDGILYWPGNIEALGSYDEHYDFIFCQSVIEHGVNHEKFFQNMARVLKPGGSLVISTDYWCEPVDTKGITMFDQPWKIYTEKDIKQIVRLAEKHGLFLDYPIDFTCGETTYKWTDGVEYTFIVFALRKMDGRRVYSVGTRDTDHG